MSADKNDDGAWFAAKTYGYGAGLPIAWQGWVLLIGYVMLMIFAGLLAQWFGEEGLVFAIPIMLVATVLFVPIVGAKTRGGMRWRWGDKDK